MLIRDVSSQLQEVTLDLRNMYLYPEYTNLKGSMADHLFILCALSCFVYVE